MLKSSLSLASLLAVAGIAASGPMSGFPSISAEAQRAAAPRFNRRSVQSRTHRRPGRIYPEQSSRQALRGSRIAQGGPGIYLGGDHRYHAVF